MREFKNFLVIGEYPLVELNLPNIFEKPILEAWGPGVGDCKSIYVPEKEDWILLLGPKPGGHPSSSNLKQEMQKKENEDLFFLNVLGLHLVKLLIMRSIIPLPDKTVSFLGVDRKDLLFCKGDLGEQIPYMTVDELCRFFYGSDPYRVILEPHECFVVGFRK
jgi:hypothetical protein